MKWRLKTATNDELRQKFVNRFAPAAMATGLVINVCEKDEDGMVISSVPDPLLKLDEKTGNWSFTQPDWDEFNRVIRGNGPCNKERVALRRFSYEQGEWVRQAILGGTTHAPSKN
jgi:ring-1,2-phenylacetyl-CoA epoxidase subunit PaaA